MKNSRTLSLLSAIFVCALTACSKGEVPAPREPQGQAPSAEPQKESGGARLVQPPVSAEGQALPPGHPPVSGAGAAGTLPAVPSDAGTGAKGLAWTTPKGWTSVPPSSSMRKAQYKVPGPGGDGECAVFYFGPGQGGDPQANAVRWAGQFKRPDGSSAEADLKTSQSKNGDLDVLIVEVKGTYSGGMTGTMEPAAEHPGYALLGAIVEGPDANWFFKLTAPEATVASQRSAFEAMVRSVRTGS